MARSDDKKKVLRKVDILNSLATCKANPIQTKTNAPSIDGFVKKVGNKITENEKVQKSIAKAETVYKKASSKIKFVTDIIKKLGGYLEMVQDAEKFLVNEIPPIEVKIKTLLKSLIKEYTSCGDNPSIPLYLKNSGDGLTVSLKKIDFFGIFKHSPESEFGVTMYNDAPSGLSSSDLNTFLYSVIQDPGNSHEWFGTNSNPILEFTFYEDTPDGPNRLNIKASKYYSDPVNEKGLIDLFFNFIDSIDVFSEEKIISGLIDILYGSVSFGLNKSIDQLITEEEINNIITNLSNVDEEVDDSFFSFSTYEVSEIQELALNRKKGIRKLIDCNNLESSISIDTIINGINNIKTGSTYNDLTENVSTFLNDAANESASQAGVEDQYNVRINFFESLIENLTNAIVINTISPKVMVSMVLAIKIVSNTKYEYKDAVDFVKKNRWLFQPLINKINDIIIAYFLKLAFKLATKKIASDKVCDVIEKAQNRRAQLLSLFGVSRDIIALINGVSREIL